MVINFSKGVDNYPPKVERSVYLLNTYKVNFYNIKKGVNLMYNEEEVALIKSGEDVEVDQYYWRKAMTCFLCNKKGYIK